MKTLRSLVLIGLTLLSVSTSLSAVEDPTRDERMEWWREARFGMFIHWGVYSVPAGVHKGHDVVANNGGWIMNYAKIPVAEYKAYANDFNPANYDPEAWVKTAKDAGMKYIVITAKHHDGFALFDTKASDWNVVDATPYKKDLLKPLAEACEKHGIKLGFYYSQTQDWCNPGGKAYRALTWRGYDRPDEDVLDAYTKEHDGYWDPVQFSKTFEEYIDGVAVPQVQELLTQYGDVAVLWWDTPKGITEEAALKLQALLSLQPDIITNNRLKSDFPGDTRTPEQEIPHDGDGSDWETCMTMNETWGYRSEDVKWKSAETLIHNLVDIASKGGNYLLNIGPKADGTFPQESMDCLKTIGEWMQVNGEAIYGTQASPLTRLSMGRCTQKKQNGNTILYITIIDWPRSKTLFLKNLHNEVLSAKVLATGEDFVTSVSEGGLVLKFPQECPDPIASVFKIVVKGDVNIP